MHRTIVQLSDSNRGNKSSFIWLWLLAFVQVTDNNDITYGSNGWLFKVIWSSIRQNATLTAWWDFARWFNFWAIVTSNSSPYAMGPLSCLSDCLSCQSVMLVYCGQMAGWIKMPLSTEVCLGPGHTVSSCPPHGKWHSSLPLFAPCLLWPNGRPSQQLLSSC